MALRIDADALKRLSREDQEEIEKELGRYEAAVERNPLWHWRPHVKQHEFLSWHKEFGTKLFAGGNQSGKTTCGLADDIIQCVDDAALPPHLRQYKHWQPPFYGRIICPDFSTTLCGVVIPKLQELVPKDQLVGGSWKKAYDKTLHVLNFKNGSRLDFLTFEQDLNKFGGATLDRVHMDEEPPGEAGRQIFHESRIRVMRRKGEIMLTMTPLLGLSWSFDTIYEKRNEDDTFCVEVDMDDNPHLTEEGKAASLTDLTDLERQARKEGKFVHFGGLVYPEYDPEAHTVRELPSRRHLQGQTIVVSIDPGVRKTAVVWVAFDKDNVAVVFDELYVDQATVELVAGQVKERNEHWGVKPNYVIDPSARNRTLINAEQIQIAYMRNGITAMPGQNALEPGILQLKRRLQHQAIFFSPTCTRLAWELRRYRIDEKKDQFAVVKEHDHLMDALRYACMTMTWGVTASKPKSKPLVWEYGKIPPRSQLVIPPKQSSQWW